MKFDDSSTDSLKTYMSEVSAIPLLTKGEEITLADDIHSGNKGKFDAARETLIISNLRLVVKIAHDFKGLGLPLADLISEGNTGLIRAAEKFDSSKGAKFSSYAAWWIKQAMRRALYSQSRTIRVPIQSASRLSKIRNAASELQDELGRPPTDSEVAERLEISEKIVAGLKHVDLRMVSIHDPIKPGEDGEFKDIIPDPQAKSADDEMNKKDAVFRLMELLQNLNERERTVLEMRFGLRGEAPCTLEDISVVLGRTRERVRQIQNNALKKLKKMLETEGGYTFDGIFG
jgi:RNA polymerase primary sigma factor